MKINYVSLCSGYGAECIAFKRLRRDYLDFDFECLVWSEIEPNACKAHDAIHTEYAGRNLGDLTKVDWKAWHESIGSPHIDLLFASTPCQSVSNAGKNEGMKKGTDAESALIWATESCIVALQPDIIMYENVKGMVSKRNKPDFDEWCRTLEDLGYVVQWDILNAKDFGTPQNRERIFPIAIREDLPMAGNCAYPSPFKLEKRIKDILEPYGTVDESFYFSAKQLANMFKYCDKKKSEGSGFQTQFTDENGIASCDTTRYGASYTDAYLKEPTLQQRLSIYDNNAQAGRVYDVNGIAPCIDTCSGGNRMPKILTPVRTEEAKELRRKGIEVFKHRELVPREDGVSNTITTFTKDNLLQEPVAVAMRGRNPDNPSDRTKGAPTEKRLEFGDNIANCITTVQKDSMVAEPMIGNDPRRIFGKDDFQSDVCPALMAVDYKAPKLVKEPLCAPNPRSTFGEERWDDIAPTLLSRDYKDPKIVREPIELSFANLPDKTVLKDDDGKGYLWQDNALWRVRRLVPIEVGRLMDCSDEDIQKMIDAGISKSKLYGLFGNSIVVSCLYHIFRTLFIPNQPENKNNERRIKEYTIFDYL